MNPKASRSLGLLALCFVVTMFAWEWLYPVNVFVVVLHEWSHGLMAILTGGSVKEIYIDFRAGGWCSHVGGWRLPTAAAGYLGSSVFGALIMLAAARTRLDKALSATLGLFLIVLAGLYVRKPFGLFFCVAFGAFMVFAGVYLSEVWNDFLLRFLGMSSCLYAVVRVRSHLLAHWYNWRSSTGDPTLDKIWANSDADTLASLTGLPATLWWVIFLAFGLLCFGFALYHSIKGEAGWGRER